MANRQAKAKVVVEKSKIRGMGVFASRDFAQGEAILTIDDTHVVDDPSTLAKHPEEFGGDYVDQVNIIWHRWGKEHGESSGFRKNDEEVIRRHLADKLERQRAQSGEAWRWWKVSYNSLAEIPLPETLPFNRLSDRETFIHYFPANDMCVVEDIALPPPRDEYYYYIHVGKMSYDGQLGSWIFVDWFIDILVTKDGNRFTVLDLDDAAEAFEKGIVTSSELCEILRSAAQVIKVVEARRLPLNDMHTARKMVQKARNQ